MSPAALLTALEGEFGPVTGSGVRASASTNAKAKPKARARKKVTR